MKCFFYESYIVIVKKSKVKHFKWLKEKEENLFLHFSEIEYILDIQ